MSTYAEKQHRLPLFEERFRQLREMREMTQSQFADFVGIARATVGFYENGDRIPDAEVLVKISRSCNVSTDWLLGLCESRSVENTDIGRTLGLSEEAIRYLKAITPNAIAEYAYIDGMDTLDGVATSIFINWALAYGHLIGIAENLLLASRSIYMQSIMRNKHDAHLSPEEIKTMGAIEEAGYVVLAPYELPSYYRSEAQMHYDCLVREYAEDGDFYKHYMQVINQIEEIREERKRKARTNKED